MIQRRGAFNLRVCEEPDPTIDVNSRKFSCEIYAAEDAEFKNRLDNTWVTVPRTKDEVMDEVTACFMFVEYVDKFYCDLLRAAASPLDNVMEDAFQRSFGWSFGGDSQKKFEDDCRKDMLEDLGLF